MDDLGVPNMLETPICIPSLAILIPNATQPRTSLELEKPIVFLKSLHKSVPLQNWGPHDNTLDPGFQKA